MRLRPVLAALACALGLGLAAGCTPDSPPAPADPQGWWRLSAGPAGAKPTDAGGPVYLRLTGGRIETLTPCSEYSASLKGVPGQAREIGNPTGEPVGCEPATMSFDARYLLTLQAVTGARVDGGALLLTGPSGELRFSPLRPVRVLAAGDGTRYRLVAVSFDGQLRAANAAPSATIDVARAGVMAGSTGCRAFSQPYSLRALPSGDMADRAADMGAGAQAIAFAGPIAKEPECRGAENARQDKWLRSILVDDAVVVGDGHLLAIANDATVALYVRGG